MDLTVERKAPRGGHAPRIAATESFQGGLRSRAWDERHLNDVEIVG